jgi:SNF2 family DNA or RNA helicase
MAAMNDKHSGGIIGHVPGMGKTMMALAFVQARLHSDPPSCLFLVPPVIVKDIIDEAVRMTYLSCSSDEEDVGKCQLTVMSTNKLYSGPDKTKIYDYKWESIFIDESHVFRNTKTIMFNNVIKLHANNRWAMSGTSLINSSDDLYAVCHYIGVLKNRLQFDKLMKSGVITDKLLIQSTREDIEKLDLKELHETVVPLQLSEAERKEYVLVVRDKKRPQLQKINEVRQLSANCAAKRAAVRNQVAEIITRSPDDKIILFSNYISTMLMYEELLKEYLPLVFNGSKTEKARNAILHTFRTSPEHRVIIIGFKCGNAGINLQVANHVILNDPFWNESSNKQAIARSYRRGQTKPVHVTRYLVQSTIETGMHKISTNKDVKITRVLARG